MQVASTAWSEFWQQTTFPPGIPPSLPNTPSLKFICHLLITELVNASPAAPLSFQSAYCCSVSSLLLLQIICALLCCQFPSAASWWWNNTLVYKLPLWFRHKCYCNCLVSWFIELCFCSSVGSLQGQASVRVTWWPQRDPSTELSVVLWWPSLHNCSSLCSCAKPVWEVELTARVAHICWDGSLFCLQCFVAQQAPHYLLFPWSNHLKWVHRCSKIHSYKDSVGTYLDKLPNQHVSDHNIKRIVECFGKYRPNLSFSFMSRKCRVSARARSHMERKQEKGYCGFICCFNKTWYILSLIFWYGKLISIYLSGDSLSDLGHRLKRTVFWSMSEFLSETEVAPLLDTGSLFCLG